MFKCIVKTQFNNIRIMQHINAHKPNYLNYKIRSMKKYWDHNKLVSATLILKISFLKVKVMLALACIFQQN